MIAPITRSLEEGSDYSPDWRHQVVADYLKKHAASGGSQSWVQLLGDERDVVIRQVVRFHLGSSLIPEAVRYALGCQQHNGLTGIASNIRAMALAGMTYDQMAKEVVTSRRNIFVFCRMYFDIERYINNETWLESLLRRDFCGGENQAKSRERRLLKSAFHKGLDGVVHLLSARQSRTPEEILELSDQVRYAVAARAMEYIEDLNDGGLPPGADDFNRHLMVSAAAAKNPVQDDRDHEGMTWVAWMLEAAERDLFPPEVNERALTLKETNGPGAMPAGGRRAKCLMLNAPPLKRVNSKVVTVSGTDDQPVVTSDDTSFEPQHIEIPAD
ncbi:MAG: hypothetical protein NTY98_01585 [Verrucomicrobia bacterium]|nr:hypothetical protein [Verrucomicrobiota bacterium]